MPDYDLFELTDLPFDPPEKAPKKVKEVINKKLNELGAQLASESQQLKRNEYNAQIAFLKDCLGEGGDCSKAIFDGEKLNNYFTKLSDARTKKVISILKETVEFNKQSGIHVITNGTIRTHVRKTKLSKERVEKIYLEAGLTILTVDPNKAYPKFPTNSEMIFEELKALRQMKDPNPQGHSLDTCTDLYAFVAYLCSNPGLQAENPADYRVMPVTTLQEILDRFSLPLSQRNDLLGKLLASIASAGKNYVFNSEDNRSAYEKHLLYHSEPMETIFKIIDTAIDADKYNAKFAENCIKQITAVFGDRDVALAIYNKAAEIVDEPYIPEKAVFYVKCSFCQNFSEFEDVSRAQKKNKCSHCGGILYKPCPKCHKLVLAFLDKCPQCGSVFPSQAMFEKFLAAAKKALNLSQFEEARNYLFQAQSANPSEKSLTKELQEQITAEEKKYERPVNDLRKLIAGRKFQEASRVLAQTIEKYPSLNVSAFDAQIKSELEKAVASFANFKLLSPSKEANSCLEILQHCADFEPAINFLRANPPIACQNFSVALDSATGNAILSWSRSAEHGITYRVIRKQGKDLPQNENDGEVIVSNTADTSYRDKGIQPGRYYSYAAFAIRFDVFSKAVATSIVLLADVTGVRCEQIDGKQVDGQQIYGKQVGGEKLDTTIRLTWTKPQNCINVTIERTANGLTTTLAKTPNESYEDKGVKFGLTYTYRLYANYSRLPSSHGVELVITPMVKIDSFTIRGDQTQGGVYKVYWEGILRDDIDLKVLVGEKEYLRLKSAARFCALTLPQDGFHTITVLAYSGGAWLRSSNILEVNTYTPCSIDKSASKLTEKPIDGLSKPTYNIELNLKIQKPLPNNVVGFYYAVRTKKGSIDGAPWLDTDDIGKDRDIRKISLKTYQNSGDKIVCTETAREESSYYVSLFTIYNYADREIVSNPSKCRFDRPLVADLFWMVFKGGSGPSGYKLTIEITANRPFDRIPALVLCACGEEQYLLSPSSPEGTRIEEFTEIKVKYLSQTYKRTSDISTNRDLEGLKLFLFEASSAPNENFVLRWATGFKGKVEAGDIFNRILRSSKRKLLSALDSSIFKKGR
jgi:hypothetical protein